ncbi:MULTISPECIES: GlxA family transcriptional regulator [Streptomyces]|uniref:GlxA family transcriptional regulator n=1 Tax=Streptomyces ramulosus TaxID=47762 RepID=A0ABW1FET3_9ACTN
MHVVAVLLPPGAVGFDLTAACQVFHLARRPDGSKPYEVLVCGDAPVTGTAAGAACFGVVPTRPLRAALGADTIVVPGVAADQLPDEDVRELLRTAAARGTRIASICTGAFLLAEAGLLDGVGATTHWLACERLARAHPAVRVDPGVLFVDNGQVLSSAGLAAGLDLCLHLVSRDHGAAVAAATARALVVPRRRDGDMAQLVRRPPGPAATARQDRLHTTLDWLHRNLHRPLTLSDIAREAGMSVRHLHRRFRELTGTTPLGWLLWARTERVRELLETTDLPIDRIAEVAGFGSAVTLRLRFRERVGTTPAAYRKSFRAGTGRERPELRCSCAGSVPAGTGCGCRGGARGRAAVP